MASDSDSYLLTGAAFSWILGGVVGLRPRVLGQHLPTAGPTLSMSLQARALHDSVIPGKILGRRSYSALSNEEPKRIERAEQHKDCGTRHDQGKAMPGPGASEKIASHQECWEESEDISRQ